MSYREHARDEKLAAEVNVDRAQMCPAAGCPNRWTVSGERGRACSAHYWSEPRDWPGITQRMQEAETERARRNAYAATRPPPPTLAQKLAALLAARACLSAERPRLAWAHQLRERHRGGARLTPEQIADYRRALYSPNASPQPEEPTP